MMTGKTSLSKKTYLSISLLGKFLSHFFLLFIRLYWGTLLILSGMAKWTNIEETASYFSSLDIHWPFFNAYLVGTIEFLGGLSLLLGLYCRFFSIPLLIVFITAYATAHSAAVLNFFADPSLFISQQIFFYLYATLIVFCFGPGLFSFDYWMEKKNFGKPL